MLSESGKEKVKKLDLIGPKKVSTTMPLNTICAVLEVVYLQYLAHGYVVDVCMHLAVLQILFFL